MFAFGLDQFIQEKLPAAFRQKWALLTNDAAQTISGQQSRVALINAGWKITCIFTPEHGIAADGIDGAYQKDGVDPLTTLPIYSLYGDRLAPDENLLQSIDGVLFDLPDTGLRFYTYLWSLSYLMEACNQLQKTLIILDRPNPLSGNLSLCEGPMLEEGALSSFIGRWRMPIRHSLSLGELGLYWQATRFPDLALKVIPCKGWKRTDYFEDLGIPFKAPSPAINSPKTYLTYPALCFLEGLNLNEGRGTPLPFQQFGAPWVDGVQLSAHLNSQEIEGVQFSPVSYTPNTNRYQGQLCHGVRLSITNKSIYHPISTGLHILVCLFQLYPKKIALARYPTLANPSGDFHLDLLLGTSKVRRILQEYPEGIIRNLSTFCSVEDWEVATKGHLIY